MFCTSALWSSFFTCSTQGRHQQGAAQGASLRRDHEFRSRSNDITHPHLHDCHTSISLSTSYLRKPCLPSLFVPDLTMFSLLCSFSANRQPSSYYFQFERLSVVPLVTVSLLIHLFHNWVWYRLVGRLLSFFPAYRLFYFCFAIGKLSGAVYTIRDPRRFIAIVFPLRVPMIATRTIYQNSARFDGYGHRTNRQGLCLSNFVLQLEHKRVRFAQIDVWLAACSLMIRVAVACIVIGRCEFLRFHEL